VTRRRDSSLVEVEVHLSRGLPTVTVVGYADTAIQEARLWVRAALNVSGFPFPKGLSVKDHATRRYPVDQDQRSSSAAAVSRTERSSEGAVGIDKLARQRGHHGVRRPRGCGLPPLVEAFSASLSVLTSGEEVAPRVEVVLDGAEGLQELLRVSG
jgi:hypothetical protein